MRKIQLVMACVMLSLVAGQAQKLSTRSGYVRFFSETKVENIEAINEQMSSIIKVASGEFAFLVPIKGFVFEKALMQEHFNENYMESGQYPNAKFTGKIVNLDSVNFEEDGEYQTTMKGKMEIHGVTKPFEEKVTLTVKDGKVSLNSKFTVKPSDYDIEIPAGKRDNISETIEVTVKASYDS